MQPKGRFHWNTEELEASTTSPPHRIAARLDVLWGLMAMWGWCGHALREQAALAAPQVLTTGPAPPWGAQAAQWPLAPEGDLSQHHRTDSQLHVFSACPRVGL